MAIKVVRYEHDKKIGWGVVHGRVIAPLSSAYSSTADFVKNGMEEVRRAPIDGTSLLLDDVRLLSPITEDRQLICQGINYESHVRESGMDPGKIGFNTIFTKASSCITSSHADVIRPEHVRLLDYEIELGLVLRRPITSPQEIRQDALHDWLAGVTIINDVSARDIQLPQAQFYKGKSYRTFGPTGPFFVLLDAMEWSRWSELRMRLSVNDQPRQDAYCGDMIFKPHETLTELSMLQNLYPGDVIATGTPAGCAARAPGKLTMWILKHLMSDQTKWRMFIKKGISNPAYLQPGDTMRASIRTDDGTIDLGEQCNRIVTP
ncbi:fumarylacetoacetate hydrolase family protein [Undibacterium terreum]|uniref:Fumarylacetoacetate hydrolase n=1 Tax=Undibacterium terreum TaxID=1224302 RepID=A0A916UKE5_9BURK|nr:fumarylacetoacetate hydrolase family protein [Undibacterium terreum]GGC75292.1 fumarylacetoacetate hydrolase [Undibacterium terreum]